jgi:VCBS repeat-containing protein
VVIASQPTNGSVSAPDPLTGEVTYTPNPDFNGEDTFTYTVKDKEGLESDPVTVTVTVGAVNDAPTTVADNVETFENAAASFNVLDNDSDTDNPKSDLEVTSIDLTGVQGNVSFDAGGNITYDPNGQFESLNENETATETFTYTVSDGDKASTETVTVTVKGVNNNPNDNLPPNAAEDNFLTDEDTELTGVNVLANDDDVDNDNSTLTVTSIDDTGVKGNITVAPNGDLTYDPNGQFDDLNVGESVIETFTYVV